MKIEELFEEQFSINEIIDKIQKDCQSYLKSINNELYSYSLRRHFVGLSNPPPFFEKATRRDRKPMDIPLEYHNFIDKWFYRKFGHHYRSGAVFAFGVKGTPDRSYSIYPIGNFEIVWSPIVKDLYEYIDEAEDQVAASGGQSNTELSNFLTPILEKANYRKGNMKEAILSENEIMIDCEKYYAVKHDLNKRVVKETMKKYTDNI